MNDEQLETVEGRVTQREAIIKTKKNSKKNKKTKSITNHLFTANSNCFLNLETVFLKGLSKFKNGNVRKLSWNSLLF